MARLSATTSQHAAATDEPTVRTLQAVDLKAALAAGLEDFKALRTDLVLLAIIYPLVGIILARLAAGYDMLPLVFPLVSGFALVGPFATLGLYELSRRREQGLESSLKNAFDFRKSRALPSIAALAVVLTAIFIVWLITAMVIYNLIFDGLVPDSVGSFLSQIFTTAAGWALIAVGVGVGFVFAVVVLIISVVSFPLLLDRPVGALTAVRVSMRVVMTNPATMALWGLIVTGLLVIGMLTLFIGLAVVVPVLGHATWHLYRRAVAYPD